MEFVSATGFESWVSKAGGVVLDWDREKGYFPARGTPRRGPTELEIALGTADRWSPPPNVRLVRIDPE